MGDSRVKVLREDLTLDGIPDYITARCDRGASAQCTDYQLEIGLPGWAGPDQPPPTVPVFDLDAFKKHENPQPGDSVLWSPQFFTKRSFFRPEKLVHPPDLKVRERQASDGFPTRMMTPRELRDRCEKEVKGREKLKQCKVQANLAPEDHSFQKPVKYDPESLRFLAIGGKTYFYEKDSSEREPFFPFLPPRYPKELFPPDQFVFFENDAHAPVRKEEVVRWSPDLFTPEFIAYLKKNSQTANPSQPNLPPLVLIDKLALGSIPSEELLKRLQDLYVSRKLNFHVSPNHGSTVSFSQLSEKKAQTYLAELEKRKRLPAKVLIGLLDFVQKHGSRLWALDKGRTGARALSRGIFDPKTLNAAIGVLQKHMDKPETLVWMVFYLRNQAPIPADKAWNERLALLVPEIDRLLTQPRDPKWIPPPRGSPLAGSKLP